MDRTEAVKGYISYLLEWLVSHGDIELDPVIEYEVVRVIMDASEGYFKEVIKNGN